MTMLRLREAHILRQHTQSQDCLRGPNIIFESARKMAPVRAPIPIQCLRQQYQLLQPQLQRLRLTINLFKPTGMPNPEQVLICCTYPQAAAFPHMCPGTMVCLFLPPARWLLDSVLERLITIASKLQTHMVPAVIPIPHQR